MKLKNQRERSFSNMKKEEAKKISGGTTSS
jgi:hypothetical protein